MTTWSGHIVTPVVVFLLFFFFTIFNHIYIILTPYRCFHLCHVISTYFSFILKYLQLTTTLSPSLHLLTHAVLLRCHSSPQSLLPFTLRLPPIHQHLSNLPQPLRSPQLPPTVLSAPTQTYIFSLSTQPTLFFISQLFYWRSTYT